jgi:uncharacterized membrane protein YeaQ/YmgE (transglycosylase-associated protein family)
VTRAFIPHRRAIAASWFPPSPTWGSESVPLRKEAIVLWFIIVLLVVGFIAGALARLLVPGPDPMSLGATWLLGVLGSFAGGFLGYLLFGHDRDDGAIQVSGVIGSIVGAVILLLIYRAVSSRRGHGGRRLHA